MMNPAHVRAAAPVARFAVLLSFGSEDECSPVIIAASARPAARRAARRRRALSDEKYIAEPHPVRSVEGSVPRQNCRMGLGPLAMERIVPRRVEVRDCCTRVLRRSAGCKSTAERMPELRPAKKWTSQGLAAVMCFVHDIARVKRSSRARCWTHMKTTSATSRHLTLPRCRFVY